MPGHVLSTGPFFLKIPRIICLSSNTIPTSRRFLVNTSIVSLAIGTSHVRQAAEKALQRCSQSFDSLNVPKSTPRVSHSLRPCFGKGRVLARLGLGGWDK